MPFAVGVDAYNLAADRRGMGRYVRRILADWESARELEVTLVVKRESDIRAIAGEFPYAVSTAARGFDAVWFPWNAMRFRSDARTVLTLHDPFAFTLPHRNLVARWREQSPIAYGVKHADALACNSHWTAREAARVFGIDETRFTVVHPVPDAFWRPAGGEARDPYVLVVAGPDKRKNLRTLFRAFERAFPEGSVALFVAGTLNEDDEFELGRARFRHVRLMPADEELCALYGGATAVAVPSTAEGYGIMAVEAMACGAPVIASDAAALPEACAGAALLVPPADVQAWSHALARIVSDGDLRERLRAQSLARAARIDRTEPATATLALLRG